METNRGLFEAETANMSLNRADLSQFCEVQRWLENAIRLQEVRVEKPFDCSFKV